MENKDRLNAKKSLDDLNKSLKKLSRITMFILFWFKFLRYLVLWGGVSIGAIWSILPVMFFWTGDYFYLKVFGTVPFCVLALYFIFHGISETIRFSTKKSDDKYKMGGNIGDSKSDLKSALKKQEEVIVNTTNTTVELLRLMNVFLTSNGTNNGKQENTTEGKKND